MKIPPLLTGLAIIASVHLSMVCICAGQSPPPVSAINSGPSATITFANSSSVNTQSRGGRFALTGVNAGETVNVQLAFSPTLATTAIVVQALDGGNVPTPDQNNAIGTDGKASLRFQAGPKPGLYRVLVNAGGAISTLQFWVADPNNPSTNPPVLKP